MVASFSSNSNYAIIGGLRCIAQSVSYEVSMLVLFIALVLAIPGYSLRQGLLVQGYAPLALGC